MKKFYSYESWREAAEKKGFMLKLRSVESGCYAIDSNGDVAGMFCWVQDPTTGYSEPFGELADNGRKYKNENWNCCGDI